MKVNRCEFCNSKIDPDDPFYEQSALKLNKKDLEEIRRYISYCLNAQGIWSDKDKPQDVINISRLMETYRTLTGFLMK